MLKPWRGSGSPCTISRQPVLLARLGNQCHLLLQHPPLLLAAAAAAAVVRVCLGSPLHVVAVLAGYRQLIVHPAVGCLQQCLGA
jgi:hypothetical protein